MTQVEKMWKAIKEFKWDKDTKQYCLHTDEWIALNEREAPFKICTNAFDYGFIKGMRYQKAQEKKKRKEGKA